jgi:redox-sensitive bicupin YhaK (pirin superfamily)
MSNIGLIVPERATHIGQFLVGRLLPFTEKRSVGPFVFIDHLGPVSLAVGEGLDVPPHPHIGLSTLTYLLEGAIMHKDSMGTDWEIKPGAVNWMTAGRGVVHSERTTASMRTQAHTLHGLQIWIALPKELEDIEPSFTHIPAHDLPEWSEVHIHYKLIAGTFDGKTSPVPVHSLLYMLELTCEEDTIVNIGSRLFGESALYVLDGHVEIEGQSFGGKQLLIAEDAKYCAFKMLKGSKAYLFGGEPLPEERFIFWNFVSSSKDKIEAAKALWQDQGFPKVPGEAEWVPLPQQRIK